VTSKKTSEEATTPTRSDATILHRAGRSLVLLLPALALAAGVGAVAGLAGASSRPSMVIAKETDFHIALSKKSFSAGKYVFVAVNKGQVTHSLEIAGPGLSSPKTKNIAPGQKTDLTVNLKKGRYDVFCPVPGHKALGMNLNITVAG
jgi:plastocyanin